MRTHKILEPEEFYEKIITWCNESHNKKKLGSFNPEKLEKAVSIPGFNILVVVVASNISDYKTSWNKKRYLDCMLELRF